MKIKGIWNSWYTSSDLENIIFESLMKNLNTVIDYND